MIESYKHRLRILIWLTPYFLFIIAVSAFAENNKHIFGKILLAEGTARKHISDSEGWLALEPGTLLEPGDSIKTLEDSRIEFSIAGNGIYRLGSESTVYLTPWVILKPELISGDMWWTDFYSGPQDDLLQVILPNSHVSAQNVAARFLAGNECTTEIKVYNGNLKLRGRKYYIYDEKPPLEESERHPCDIEPAENDSLSDYSVTLESGQKLILSSKGYIIYQGQFSADDPDEDTDWVRWNKERDQSEQDSKY